MGFNSGFKGLMFTYVAGLGPHCTQAKGALNWFECESGHRIKRRVSWP